MMNNELDINIIIRFIQKSGIQITNITDLNNYIIERSILLIDSKIDNMKEEIEYIKKFFGTSVITSLQNNNKQKWVLLNLVRQVLKNIQYKMIPFRKSNGYDIHKKKKFIRYFKIEKIIMVNK